VTAGPAVPLPGRFRALVCDVGGVLTTPLPAAFAAFGDHAGIPLEALGRAVATVAEDDGVHPIHELELGRATEADVLDRIGGALAAELGRPVAMHEFAARYWAALGPNEAMLDLAARVRAAGYRTALLTNNVREWEPRWRSIFAVDELFEVVVDSAFVGLRKPDPAIYRLTCARLGLEPAACLFVDDLEPNVEAARALGLGAVHYREPAQAVGDVLAALAEA
jgi:putative hydrolase of the HAD superfamily